MAAKRTDAWARRRAEESQARQDKLVRLVSDSGTTGMTSEDVAKATGIPWDSAQRILAVIVAKSRLKKAPKFEKDGKRFLGAYVHPQFFERHMQSRKQAKILSRPEIQRAQDFARSKIIKAIEGSGIPGISSPQIAEKTGVALNRVYAIVANLRMHDEVIAGVHLRGRGQDGTRWVMPGMRQRNLDYWESQELPAAVRTNSPEAEKRRLERERLLGRWAEEWLKRPVGRFVPAGEWKAEPIKAPRSVFEVAQ